MEGRERDEGPDIRLRDIHRFLPWSSCRRRQVISHWGKVIKGQIRVV